MSQVMPRHAYTSSNAALTLGKSGSMPEVKSLVSASLPALKVAAPNLRLALTTAADAVLQWCTSGSTAAANVAPSAAFFAVWSLTMLPTLYA